MKVNYCFLERFNNYFNRKLIRYTDLQDYEDNSQASFIPLNSDSSNPALFDFNPNDNITSEIIVNDVPFDPDYFLILDPEDESIMQRWFVLEQKRERNGQWHYFLRRDVLADSYNELLQAPLYVEKGIINDIENPLLLNNEGLTVNQIKKEEILLEDATKCPWLVMYIKKGVLGSNSIGNAGKVDIDVPDNDGDVYETLTTPIGSWNMAQYENTDYNVWNTLLFQVYWTQTNTINDYRYQCKKDSSSSEYIIGTAYTTNLRYNANTEASFRELLDTQFKANYNTLVTKLKLDKSYGTYDGIWKYNNKIIKDSLGKYYQIQVYSRGVMPIPTWLISDTEFPNLKAQMAQYWNLATGQSVSPNNEAFGIRGNYEVYRLTITEIESISTKVDFSAYLGNGAVDCPLYDVIAMPFGNVHFSNPGNLLYGLDTSAERSLRVMNSLARNLGSSYVLDFQLLPYCPCQELIHTNIIPTTIMPLAENYCAIYASNGGGVTDVLLAPNKINFTFDITKSISITDLTDVASTYKKKYVNDCTLVRICSPNYNGVFEMNLAKNDMSIEYFNVDVTLKPQTPYIHINPNFKSLYNRDFDDARGLICGGDFSLGIMDEAWVTYEIQNKNYQNIFDRQIQNMDVNNAIIRQEALFGAVAGGVQGAGMGAVLGGKVGGGYGAAAGALIGGATSTIGGVLDLQNLDTKIKENRQYAIDNYNLSLGNIKALPYGITRTSCLTANNKKIPFVEIYECTEREKEAYYDKLKYSGMSVMAIDKMIYYISDNNENYFKAHLIRITTISEDYHYAQVLNEELEKGVFI